MTSRYNARIDRAVRIELLRARAAVEREALAGQFTQVGRSLGPLALLGGLSTGGGSWLAQGVALLRQYPFLLSSLSALFARRRGGALKAGGLAMLLWQGWRLWRGQARRAAKTSSGAGRR